MLTGEVFLFIRGEFAHNYTRTFNVEKGRENIRRSEDDMVHCVMDKQSTRVRSCERFFNQLKISCAT